MRVEIYLYANQGNGAPFVEPLFKKGFDTWTAPPSIGTIILLGSIGVPKGSLKTGVVTDVRVAEHSARVRVGTEDASTEALRDCLSEDGWEETPPFSW